MIMISSPITLVNKEQMTLHNVSPFGLLQVQNDTNTKLTKCVRVIMHLRKPKRRKVHSHLFLLTEVIGLLILYTIVLWNPSEERFEQLKLLLIIFPTIDTIGIYIPA